MRINVATLVGLFALTAFAGGDKKVVESKENCLAESVPTEYFACTKDSDCLLVTGPHCCDRIGINQAFKTAFEKWRSENCNLDQCKVIRCAIPQATTACKSGRCQTSN